VDAIVEQGFLNRDLKMIGHHTKENVGVDPTFEMAENWSFNEWRFEIAKGIFGARKQNVDAPELVA
jgi:hypothetical protein